MDHDPTTAPATDPRVVAEWQDASRYLVGLASRMLHDPVEAEDVVQDAFGRLARVQLDDIEDVRGWLAVVVRRLCLDRLKSAHARREQASGDTGIDELLPVHGQAAGDPLDRVTLDDQIQLALAVVLDRLSPPERTAFVLHDVFGFPFDAVGEIVGRTPAACRQLASRARRSIRSGSTSATPTEPAGQHQVLVERFIAACSGGDINEVMALLDPSITGDAVFVGRGPIVHLEGVEPVARRLLALFGPSGSRTLLPVPLEDEVGVVAFDGGRVNAIIRLDVAGGLVKTLHSYVLPPPQRDPG